MGTRDTEPYMVEVRGSPLESGAGIYSVEARGCPLESGAGGREGARGASGARRASRVHVHN